MRKKGILVVISGFSGAGKGTLMKNLLAKYDYSLSISMTTRLPREGEKNGKEYYFVSRDEFEKTINENGLIEYAEYCNNYYGTPRKYVERELEAGRDVILEIEAQGALQIKKKFPDCFTVFVLTPDVKSLDSRLRSRGTEDNDVILKREKRAAQEVELIPSYDAIVINDDLEKCTEEIDRIIQASKNATNRNREFIESFRKQFDELLEEGE